MDLPFEDESFDGVISNGSLHEWEFPVRVFDEIHRVLRPKGRCCLTDLRRDVPLWKKWFVYAGTKPKEMRWGLITSLNAAYTLTEISELVRNSALYGGAVKPEFFGLCVFGQKD